jgi:radical SAM-linked protein
MAEATATLVTEERGGSGEQRTRTTLRVRFTKHGKIRFTSHRDVARMWERALRRSGLSVAYSEGFSPRPLLSFGLALPTGCESDAEYLDIRLDGEAATPEAPESTEELTVRLSGLLPDGVLVQALAPIPKGAPSLQQEVTSCSWDLELLGAAGGELAERVERLLGAECIVVERERKGRQVQDDLRPSVLALSPVASHNGSTANTPPVGRLEAELATQPRGVRPEELVQGLGGALTLLRGRRTHQWIERDGVRSEPLSPGGRPAAAATPHATERAT